MADNLFQKDIGQVSPPSGGAPVAPPAPGLAIASNVLSTVAGGLQAYLSGKPEPTKDDVTNTVLGPMVAEVDRARQQYERDGNMMAYRTRVGQLSRQVAVDAPSYVDDFNDIAFQGFGIKPQEDEATLLRAQGSRDPEWALNMALAKVTESEEGLNVIAAAHLATPLDATPEERALIVEGAAERYMTLDAQVTQYTQINNANLKGAKLTGMAGSVVPAMARDYFGAAMSPETTQVLLQSGEGYRVFEAVQESNRRFEETFLRLGAEKGYSFDEAEQEVLFGRTRQGIKSWGKIVGATADESLAARNKHIRNVMLDWMVGDGKVATPTQVDAIEQQMAILNSSGDINAVSKEFLEYLRKENEGNKQYAVLTALTDLVDIVPSGSVISKDIESSLDERLDFLLGRDADPAEVFHVSQGILNSIQRQLQEEGHAEMDFGTRYRLQVSANNMSVASSKAAFDSGETMESNNGTATVAMEGLRPLLTQDYGEANRATRSAQDRATRNVNKQKAKVNQELDGVLAGTSGIGKDTYLSESGRAVRAVFPDSELGNLITLYNSKFDTDLPYDTSALTTIGKSISTGGEGVFSDEAGGISSDATVGIALAEEWVAENYKEFDRLDVIAEIDRGLRAFSKDNPHLKPELLSTKPVGQVSLQSEVDSLVTEEVEASSPDFTDAPQIDIEEGVLGQDFDTVFSKAIISFEGERLEAYQDDAGVWTVGVGHTGPDVGPDTVITKEESRRLLAEDTKKAKDAVLAEVKDLDLPDTVVASLVSFAFNVGTAGFRRSTALRLIKEGKIEEGAEAMLMWNKVTDPKTGKKVVSRGLTNRRKKERDMILSAISTDKENV